MKPSETAKLFCRLTFGMYIIVMLYMHIFAPTDFFPTCTQCNAALSSALCLAYRSFSSIYITILQVNACYVRMCK